MAEEGVGSKRAREGPVSNDEAVKLAMKLIDVESLSGHEQPMAVVLKDWLEKRNWVVELQEVEPQKGTVGGKVRHNLYARRSGVTAKEGPRVLFNSHIDTASEGLGFRHILNRFGSRSPCLSDDRVYCVVYQRVHLLATAEVQENILSSKFRTFPFRELVTGRPTCTTSVLCRLS